MHVYLHTIDFKTDNCMTYFLFVSSFGQTGRDIYGCVNDECIVLDRNAMDDHRNNGNYALARRDEHG
ncbi:hypothetical protein DT065_09115 [Salicibibacter kimchii]|uniref:Uncharacterized protein n=1 Tax=Salicibibacter kimchii TaxID=2099786 RepID=A0A345BYY3_9BACI|nr:hypothetical protein DT065_09115 [Salicibibacter kimchii]